MYFCFSDWLKTVGLRKQMTGKLLFVMENLRNAFISNAENGRTLQHTATDQWFTGLRKWRETISSKFRMIKQFFTPNLLACVASSTKWKPNETLLSIYIVRVFLRKCGWIPPPKESKQNAQAHSMYGNFHGLMISLHIFSCFITINAQILSSFSVFLLILILRPNCWWLVDCDNRFKQMVRMHGMCCRLSLKAKRNITKLQSHTFSLVFSSGRSEACARVLFFLPVSVFHSFDRLLLYMKRRNV